MDVVPCNLEEKHNVLISTFNSVFFQSNVTWTFSAVVITQKILIVSRRIRPRNQAKSWNTSCTIRQQGRIKMADLSIKKPYFLITWYKYNNQLYLQQSPLLNHSFPSSPIWCHTIYSYVSESLLLRSCYHAKQGSGLQNHFFIRTLFLLHTGLYSKIKKKKKSQILLPENQRLCVCTCVLKSIHMSTDKNFLCLFMLHPDGITRELTKIIILAEEVQKWIDQFFFNVFQ